MSDSTHPAGSPASVHLIVRGRVQGVGFRDWVDKRARGLGLHGVVRNLAGGEVEVEAEGDRARLEDLVLAVKQGPANARVDEVDIRWGNFRGAFHGFEIGF